ncbi:MAG TPA: hypothetical protein VGD14_16220 [bacterium]
MFKIIIGIHGLGNKPPQKILKKWWKRSIFEGLAAIGQPRFFFKFELVYWANLLYPQPLSQKGTGKDDPDYLEEPYVPAKKQAPRSPSKVRKKILDYLEKQFDRIFLKEDLSIHFASISDLIIRRFFKDLDVYYSQKSIHVGEKDYLVKDVIRDQLERVIKKHRKKDILLIGHSMGSIIAYDVLTNSLPEVAIDTFITIGSPLGLPVIMSKIASEQRKKLVKSVRLKTPENVTRNWYNCSDLNDKVSFNYSLADDYDQNSKQVHVIDKIVTNDYEINGHRNPHKIYGYLRTPEFSELIQEFLDRGKNKKVVWLLDKINHVVRKIYFFEGNK